MPYTVEDKLKCLRRELALRHRVYPARIAVHKMTEAEAAREIAIIMEMIEDYTEMEWSNVMNDEPTRPVPTKRGSP